MLSCKSDRSGIPVFKKYLSRSTSPALSCSSYCCCCCCCRCCCCSCLPCNPLSVRRAIPFLTDSENDFNQSVPNSEKKKKKAGTKFAALNLLHTRLDFKKAVKEKRLPFRYTIDTEEAIFNLLPSKLEHKKFERKYDFFYNLQQMKAGCPSNMFSVFSPPTYVVCPHCCCWLHEYYVRSQ